MNLQVTFGKSENTAAFVFVTVAIAAHLALRWLHDIIRCRPAGVTGRPARMATRERGHVHPRRTIKVHSHPGRDWFGGLLPGRHFSNSLCARIMRESRRHAAFRKRQVQFANQDVPSAHSQPRPP
ncbi:MAG: hypothetical protein HGA75_07490 [Thiobacillus sp.]|nr:hypothetical protein [Thiobacillus sp.]